MKAAVRGGTDRRLAATTWLLRESLYDDLGRRCSTLLGRRLAAPVRFKVHRLLAEAYGEVQRQLSLLGIGHPEGHWAAALASRHVEGSFRSAAGAAPSMEGEE
jgi:hypothetical protein